MTEAACHFIAPTTMQGLSGKPVRPVGPEHSERHGTHQSESYRGCNCDCARKRRFHCQAGAWAGRQYCPQYCAWRATAVDHCARDEPRKCGRMQPLQRNVAQLIAAACGSSAGQRRAGMRRRRRGTNAGGSAIITRRRGLFPTQNTFRQKYPDHCRPDLRGGATHTRGITNRSPAKWVMGIARAAHERGTEVTLISGPTSLAKPHGVQSEDVQSATECFEAVKRHVGNCDSRIGVAAVAELPRPHKRSRRAQKISRWKFVRTRTSRIMCPPWPTRHFSASDLPRKRKSHKYADRSAARKNCLCWWAIWCSGCRQR